MSSDRRKLSVVGQPEHRLDLADDIYRHGRERAKDREHWAKVHIRSDRSPPVRLGQAIKRIVLGSGVRTERGGFISERRP